MSHAWRASEQRTATFPAAANDASHQSTQAAGGSTEPGAVAKYEAAAASGRPLFASQGSAPHSAHTKTHVRTQARTPTTPRRPVCKHVFICLRNEIRSRAPDWRSSEARVRFHCAPSPRGLRLPGALLVLRRILASGGSSHASLVPPLLAPAITTPLLQLRAARMARCALSRETATEQLSSGHCSKPVPCHWVCFAPCTRSKSSVIRPFSF